MTDKKHNKKVNRLTLKECEGILQKLVKDKESLYYQHVLAQYRKLIPSMESATVLGQISVEDGKAATFITNTLNKIGE